MLASNINNLTGAQPNPASTKTGQPNAANAQAFGDLLSREIGGRQNGASADAPPARPDNAAARPPAQSSQQADAARAAARNDAQVRQDRQATQKNQDAQDAQDRQADATQAADAAASAAADAASGARTTSTATGKQDAAAGKPKTAAKDDTDAARKTDTATTDATQAASLSAAAAELQALVTSLAPRAAPAATAPAEVTVTDAKSTGTKGAALLATKDAKADADAAPAAASDPAFDALLAQAAQLTQQTRDGARPATGKAAPLPRDDAATAAQVTSDDGRTPEAAGTIKATPDAALQAKTDQAASLLARDIANAGSAKAAIEAAPVTGLPVATAAVATSAVQGVGGAHVDTLTPHVGTPAWDHALGQKVVWMAAGAEQTASLTLNPPDLGPMQIVINVSNAQADASFTAAQPEVRQALEAAMPKLKEMLQEAGISLGQTSVNAGSPNQQGTPGEQQARRGNGGPGNGNGAAEGSDRDPAIRGGMRQISRGNGLVDTFV
jgi:flagellar hook-length control protein FliK